MKNIFFTISAILSIAFFNASANPSIGENKKNITRNNVFESKQIYSKAITTKLQDPLPAINFDENNIVTKFAVIADIHIQEENGTPSQKLAAVLEQINTKANGNLDVLLVAGDLTDYGLPEQVTELKRVFDNSKVDLNKTRFVFAIGNHEYYNHQLKEDEWIGGYLFENVFGEQSYTGATDDEIKAANYHAVVNGYDYIAVNCVQYDGGVKYADSDIEWLKNNLAKAAAEHPGQPIFVASHPNITGTNFGGNEGDYWAGSDLYDVFKNYPQVIFFCGHLHFPENDERSIWQGDFTAIGLGSTYYCSNHPTDDDNGNSFIDLSGGYESSDALKTSQGLFVEIDKNNNIRITRMDFANNEQIKTPWLIPAPSEDKSNLLYYTPAQIGKTFGKTAPVFPSGASVVEVIKSVRQNYKYQFKFTQAVDNDLVYSYQVSFIDKESGNTIKTISVLSDFYLYANPNEISSTLTKTFLKADSLLAPFSLTYKKDYFIKVVAIDCFGLKSEPIYSGVITDVREKNEQGAVPFGLRLLQNYPNPFNPSTIINYQLLESGYVTLKVYDVLGREAKTLVNENQNAGEHTVLLDASNLSSGVYCYKLETAGYSCVKKFVKLK